MCSAYLDDELSARAREAGIEVCVTKSDVRRLPDVLHSLAGS